MGIVGDVTDTGKAIFLLRRRNFSGVSLPIYPGMSDANVEKVINIVTEVATEAKR
jgi:hypothetical protein